VLSCGKQDFLSSIINHSKILKPKKKNKKAQGDKNNPEAYEPYLLDEE